MEALVGPQEEVVGHLLFLAVPVDLALEGGATLSVSAAQVDRTAINHSLSCPVKPAV